MAANYLHGVEFINVKKGARTVLVVKSSVIALVGIAPIGPVNTPTLVLSPDSAAQFGEKVPGFNIPQALDAIFKQGTAVVIVVNTFNSTTNTANVTLESKTITDGKLKLAYAPIGTVSIFEADGTTPSTLVKDTDYTLDEYGNFTALTAEAADGTLLKFTYKRLDAGTVTSSQIIGTYNPSTQARTGIKCFDLIYPLFGFNAKVLIAPGYSELATVATELITKAASYKAYALIDAPSGTTVEDALAARSPAGSLAGFNTSNKRVIPCYPYMRVQDVATETEILQPLSQYLAGVISFVDATDGYWFSPSNREILGVLGPEFNITANISDANTQANLLNEKGIVTVFKSPTGEFRTWGNRNASYPTNTSPDNFIPVQRVADIIDDSVSLAMLQFIDQPINNATIDAIRETVNGFIRTLIGRGALIDGRCKFVRTDTKNTDEQIANGQLIFDIDFMPPTPAERITFNAFIDITLLKSLGTV